MTRSSGNTSPPACVGYVEVARQAWLSGGAHNGVTMKNDSRDDLVSVTAIIAGTVVSVVVTVVSMLMSDEKTLGPTSAIDAIEISIEATEGGVFIDPNVHGRSRARVMRYEALARTFEAEFERQRPIIRRLEQGCNASSLQSHDNTELKVLLDRFAVMEPCAETEAAR